MAVTTAYLAPDGFLHDLLVEIGAEPRLVHGRLVTTEAPERAHAWVANVWRDPELIEIASIGAAARELRARQRNWVRYSFDHHRRAALIEERLPPVSGRPLAFGDPAPTAPLGSWTLLEPNLLLAARTCSSPFPNGEARFLEDREGPPSRAYLKLWELFTRIGLRPQPGESCLDLGASPGGWTWVLAGLGARVTSIDKAPLEPRVAAMPGVRQLAESAFGYDPRRAEPVDWLFSDVVCYPRRLYGLVQRWLDSGKVRRLVCTLKFQGPTDFETQAAFGSIPGSRLLHLHHNKHELTWLRL